jgi:fructokinase
MFFFNLDGTSGIGSVILIILCEMMGVYEMDGVICLGEALIDFLPLDAENLTYQKSPGGAPANVAVAVAKLGGKATFVGKVGNDVLGTFLVDTLASHGVDTSEMVLTDEARTGLVFVTLDQAGERSFSFYINPSADQFLNESEIRDDMFQGRKIFHFGSISLINEPSRSATKKAVRLAKEAGLLISYDPNLRLSLWESPETAKQTILSMLQEADIVKLSDEELKFLTGFGAVEDGIKALEMYQIPLLFVTMGGNGCLVKFKGNTQFIPVIEVEMVDATGAGDAFVSGILYSLNAEDKQLADLELQDIQKIAKFAAVSGALAVSKKGAMTALPTLQQVNEILQNVNS